MKKDLSFSALFSLCALALILLPPAVSLILPENVHTDAVYVTNIFNPHAAPFTASGLAEYALPDINPPLFWYAAYALCLFFAINTFVLFLKGKSIPVDGELILGSMLVYCAAALTWIFLRYWGIRSLLALPLTVCMASVLHVYVHIRRRSSSFTIHEKRYVQNAFSVLFAVLVLAALRNAAELATSAHLALFEKYPAAFGMVFQFIAVFAACRLLFRGRDYGFAAVICVYLLMILSNNKTAAAACALPLFFAVLGTGIGLALYDWQIRYTSLSPYMKPSAHSETAAEKIRS